MSLEQVHDGKVTMFIGCSIGIHSSGRLLANVQKQCSDNAFSNGTINRLDISHGYGLNTIQDKLGLANLILSI